MFNRRRGCECDHNDFGKDGCACILIIFILLVVIFCSCNYF